ncbi:MAG: Hint domain-containing protein [Rhodobacter sp.]|nr:Hint domain-containing protein [Rhodobacter sp.]
MADKVDGIFISEILADNAGGSAIDTDNDGNTNKADEFIELQNSSGSTVSLDGFEIWSEKNGLLYSFGPGDTLAPGATATVVGNYSGTVPSGYYDGGASESSNWIPDGEGQKYDTIFLVNSNTGDYVTLSYGNPPRTPTLPTGFTGTNQIGSGETIDSTAPNGTAFARDSSGTLVETTPTPGSPNVPCFVAGTLIATEIGDIPIERLAPGDRILTLDSGFVPLRAIGSTLCSRAEQMCHPHLLPVICPPGSLGNEREFRCSRSHRALFRSAAAELYFGQNEVLSAAGLAIGYRGIHVAPIGAAVHYFHLLFDKHEVVLAEGWWAESLFLGDLAKNTRIAQLSWAVQPGIAIGEIQHEKTARRTLRRFETAVMLCDTAPASEVELPLAA